MKSHVFEDTVENFNEKSEDYNNERVNYVFWKKVFDIVFAITLLPFLLPFIGIIAILIRFDSKGPAFFANKRVGKGGKIFDCYKFRTMVVNAEDLLQKMLEDKVVKEEWENNIKLKNDPRITRVGAFLRKLSLDELPQIFNVIKGDMSFVGPRPMLEEEIPKYGLYIKEYESLRPGITGLWQINGRNNSDYSQRIEFLIVYCREKSLALDLKIILKTLPVALSKRGAY